MTYKISRVASYILLIVSINNLSCTQNQSRSRDSSEQRKEGVSSSDYQNTQQALENCLQYNTFKFRSGNNYGVISFSNNQFDFKYAYPVDVASGYYEQAGKNIRLIKAQKSSNLPSFARLIDCKTLSISGYLFERNY